ncbi:hypothetical protein [Mesorhizobium sp. YM1C-6-2]|uniref:hypothetical protein n=1 Tax=Mesorhizobium sp. YM1C-6-2 TaxID=1827501 RepID=UPI000EF25BC1|nr:hypothetical protein [Mesorhizobium sp. YM1C-6-2]RLP21992.1 hypothetical protein D8676_26375 [Mesorhizobium sp. YM1C-6-2]
MADTPVSIGIDDIVLSRLTDAQRDVMLDVILVWGKLDGAMGMMVAKALGKHPVEGADFVKDMSTSSRFLEIYKQLKDHPGGQAAARTMKKHKKKYELWSKVRNRIAHSNCVGHLRGRPDWIVFQLYQREGEGLAIEATSIEEMKNAIRWGRAMTDLALKVSEPIG